MLPLIAKSCSEHPTSGCRTRYLTDKTSITQPAVPAHLDMSINDPKAAATQILNHRMGHAYLDLFCKVADQPNEAPLSSVVPSSFPPKDKKPYSRKKYECFICGSVLGRKSRLLTHMRIHADEREYKCTKCAKTFNDRSNWKNHEKIHTEKNAFVCKRCGRSFSVKSYLNKHERRCAKKVAKLLGFLSLK